MYLNSILLLGAFVASSAAQRESRDRSCIDLDIPVAVDANNTIFGNFPRIDSSSDAANAAVVLTTWSSVDGALRPTGFRSIRDVQDQCDALRSAGREEETYSAAPDAWRRVQQKVRFSTSSLRQRIKADDLPQGTGTLSSTRINTHTSMPR